MRKLVYLIVMIPAVALAMHSFNEGDGATWDCGKDPKVAINTSDSKYTFTGACELITNNGSNNKLTIESVKQLTINGGNTDATIGTLGKTTINGNDNKVVYTKAASGKKAGLQSNGNNNSLKQQEPAKGK